MSNKHRCTCINFMCRKVVWEVWNFLKIKKKLFLKLTTCQTTYLCCVVSDVRVLIQNYIKSNQINFNFISNSNRINSIRMLFEIKYFDIFLRFFFAFFSINSKRVHLKQTTTKEFYLFSAFSIGNKSIICLQSNLFFLIFLFFFFYEIFK